MHIGRLKKNIECKGNNMNQTIFKIIGVIGLVFICVAMTVKNRQKRNVLSTIGGTGLLIYSIYLKDIIFTVLQAVYIIVVCFDYVKEYKKKHAK